MRVAVVAVHGVADQQPGETAASVANLLVSSSPPGSAYTASATEQFVLHVPPLDLGDAAEHRNFKGPQQGLPTSP
jgi:hypothetical protein